MMMTKVVVILINAYYSLEFLMKSEFLHVIYCRCEFLSLDPENMSASLQYPRSMK